MNKTYGSIAERSDDEDVPTNHDLRLYGEFNGKNDEYMQERLDEFLNATGLEYDEELFKKAVYLVKDGIAAFGSHGDATLKKIELSESERYSLQLDEVQHKNVPRQRRGFSINGDYSPMPAKVNSSWNINTEKWRLRSDMWQLVIICALGALVQGWDEAAINGAQPFFIRSFQLDLLGQPAIIGLINGAPYLCCFFSCWLTPYMNSRFGRRGTIFLTAILSAVFALLQGFAQSWQALFAYRFLLGLGIGPKSATIPIYASEGAPHIIRGSLVMLWQLFTAFGIMLGSIAGVAFQGLGTPACPAAEIDPEQLLWYECSMNWRFILASPAVAPTFLAVLIYTQPESPRFNIARAHDLRLRNMPNRAKRRYQDAFDAFRRLRSTPIQAARDMFAVYHLLKSEQHEASCIRDDVYRGWYRKGFGQLISVRRNRRALLASIVCMFAQQFCGVNALIYYSNTIFSHNKDPSEPKDPTEPDTAHLRRALLFSMGIGIINLVLGIPAFFTIDAIGRRSLLLFTFPFLALFQFLTAIAVKTRSEPFLWVTTYLFVSFYSPGEGPVPFVYAAESMPLHIRDKGMGVATSINWLFNWAIAMSFPALYSIDDQTFAPFIWYGVWCIILWFMIFFLVPETRQLSLEQLDEVFGVTAGQFASHALAKAKYHVRHFLDRNTQVEKPKPLYTRRQDLELTSRLSTFRPTNETLDEEQAEHRLSSGVQRVDGIDENLRTRTNTAQL